MCFKCGETLQSWSACACACALCHARVSALRLQLAHYLKASAVKIGASQGNLIPYTYFTPKNGSERLAKQILQP